MRFLLVVAIWIVIVGGLWSYVSHRDSKRQQIVVNLPVDLSVEGQFTAEITPTFSTEKDPFALTTSDNRSAFEIKLNGAAIDVNAEDLIRGQTVRIENISGVLAGHNEVFVTASPPLSENTMEHGIRVKFYEDSTLLVDKTLWAEQGALVSGTVSFSHSNVKEDSHGH